MNIDQGDINARLAQLRLRIELHRLPSGDAAGTPGTLVCLAGDDVVFQCRTLELPWKGNARDVSCIPAGEYHLVPRAAGRFYAKAHEKWKHDHGFHVKDVPDRDFVLCHWGNFLRDTAGCLLLGTSAATIEGTQGKQHMVGGSVAAYRAFYSKTKWAFWDKEKGGAVLSITDMEDEAELDMRDDRSGI